LTITETEFEEIFIAAVKYKYYHGRIPRNELLKFKQKVAEDIVTQVIVHRDAQKKGLQPDHQKIAQGLNEYDNKYADSPEWQGRRDRVMPLLTKRLERQNLLEKMESKIKNIPQPEADQITEYYEKYKGKFTEPKRVWGSIILLKVPPSAEEKTWTKKIDAAEQLKHRVEKGEEFATLAKQYSGHPSAVNGGDLGYLHQGMLDAGVQEKVEALAIKQISDPIRVLEGIVLFRLNGVQTEKLKPFDEVKQRAAGLFYRELQDEAWDDYVRELKASANIYVNEKLYVQNNHE
jgi:parvulin-like peptidyl-prolyl isomerase